MPLPRLPAHRRGRAAIFPAGGPDYLQWTRGTPATYTRPDRADAVTRSFCATCGTHVVTRRTDQRALVLKVGTLDEPADFAPQFAICWDEAQPYHTVADGLPRFDGIPR